MTIVCAVEKYGDVCIAADTQTNFGSIRVNTKYMKSHQKIHEIGNSIIGLCGWSATTLIFEHLLKTQPEKFRLESRASIFETLLDLQHVMTEEYFIETKEEDDQPVDSIQIDGMIINDSGIYRIGSYREVHHHSCFWAIGSGQKFALGAMHALFEMETTAQQIAIAGVSAAAEFDDGCGLPIQHKTMKLSKIAM